MALTWTPEDGTLAAADDAARSARYASSRPWIISGLALSAGTGLNVAVSAGAAWIAGYYVEWDASAQQAVTGSATNHVWIALARDGNDNVTGVSFVINTTGTPPSGDFVKLGTATTDGSTVTGTATTGRSPETQVDPSVNEWGDIGGTLSDQTDLQNALNDKRANTMDTNRILGRVTAGTGAIEELTAAQVLTFLGLTGEMPKASASSSDQTINSATNADVTGLSITGLSASAVYEITVKIFAANISGAENLLIRSVVTGRSGTIYASGNSSESFETNRPTHTSYATDDGNGIAINLPSNGAESFSIYTFRFATDGSGGTFKIQAAMNGGGSSASISAGASIIATRIS